MTWRIALDSNDCPFRGRPDPTRQWRCYHPLVTGPCKDVCCPQRLDLSKEAYGQKYRLGELIGEGKEECTNAHYVGPTEGMVFNDTAWGRNDE